MWKDFLMAGIILYMKKGVTKLLIAAMLCSQTVCLAEETFQGHAIKDEERQERRYR